MLMRELSSDFSQNSSSDFSCFDSEASRIDYWKDINTKDSDYANAIIVSKKNQSQSKIMAVNANKQLNEEVL